MGGCWPELSNILSILFDQWWHARWCIRYATVFIEILNDWNWVKKLIFKLILRVFFIDALLHLISYVPRFCKFKDLVSSVASFINTGYLVAKFKAFCIDSPSMKWLYSPKYFSVLLKFWLEVVSNKTDTVSKVHQNFEFWLNSKAPKVYSFRPFWRQIYQKSKKAKKPKKLLKTRTSVKTTHILRNIK